MSRALAIGFWLFSLFLTAGALYYLPLVRAYTDPAAADGVYRLIDAVNGAAFLGLVTVGLIIILRSTSQRYGWLLLITGFAFVLDAFTGNYSVYALVVRPAADLPLALAAGWIQNLWIMTLALLFVYTPLFFPDGKLPSPRWRPVFWFITLYLGITVLGFAFVDAPLTNVFLDVAPSIRNPLGIIPGDILPAALGRAVIGSVAFLFLLSMAAAVGGLVYRWREGSKETRQQIKWLLFALGLLVIARMVEWLLFVLLGPLLGGVESAYLPYIRNFQPLALLGVEVALAFAVLKYRLYDIDLIINRTLVYGGLTVIIILGYVLLVNGLGVLLPGDGNLLPSIMATGIVAALFAPLRERLQRAANRLVYGDRRRPFEVMRSLGNQLDRSNGSGRILPAIAKMIASSLKLPYVAITLVRGGDRRIVAEYGTRRGGARELGLDSRAKTIGYLTVCPRSGENELAPEDQELLGQIAIWLGPVADASLLTSELRRSHARLISAQAEERRRLYRDLHDGLGPALATQTFRFDRALAALPDDPETAAQIMKDLKEQTQRLVLEIRRLVYALRSSALDELGLKGALREAIAGLRGSADGLRITLDIDEQRVTGLPAAHEEALQRIALEALNNVIRHAEAEQCRLQITVEDSPLPVLQLTVDDDGHGLPPGYSPGVGIASMIERAEALGGRLMVDAVCPHGTRVVARLPLRDTPYLMEQL